MAVCFSTELMEIAFGDRSRLAEGNLVFCGIDHQVIAGKLAKLSSMH
jgi:hypothetical protein